MKTISATQAVAIPKGVQVDVVGKKVKVTGPRGTLERDFSHINMNLAKLGKKRLEVTIWWGKHKHNALVRTVCTQIENLIVGVTKGYSFKMRFVYAHFPINTVINNNGKNIEIRNFLGEKEQRKVDMLDGVIVDRSEAKDEIVVSGNDLNLVSQSCALIHQKALVRGKDIRKFLDGLYVSSGGPIEGKN